MAGIRPGTGKLPNVGTGKLTGTGKLPPKSPAQNQPPKKKLPARPVKVPLQASQTKMPGGPLGAIGGLLDKVLGAKGTTKKEGDAGDLGKVRKLSKAIVVDSGSTGNTNAPQPGTKTKKPRGGGNDSNIQLV